MCPGGTESDSVKVRKTFVIQKELSRLNVDIAGLQETRLLESGCSREEGYTWKGESVLGYTFFWKGKGAMNRSSTVSVSQ